MEQYFPIRLKGLNNIVTISVKEVWETFVRLKLWDESVFLLSILHCFKEKILESYKVLFSADDYGAYFTSIYYCNWCYLHFDF